MYNNQKKRRNKNDDFQEKAKKNFSDHYFLIKILDHESINVIKNFMQYYVKDITSSQLRNVYNVIIDKNTGNATKRVKVAYTAARNNNMGMHAFLSKLDDMLAQNGDYETIHNFAEACVAYHKYYDTLNKRY